VTGPRLAAFVLAGASGAAACTGTVDAWCQRAADECGLLPDEARCRNEVEDFLDERSTDPPAGFDDAAGSYREQCERLLEACLGAVRTSTQTEGPLCRDFELCILERDDAEPPPATAYDCHPFIRVLSSP